MATKLSNLIFLRRLTRLSGLTLPNGPALKPSAWPIKSNPLKLHGCASLSTSNMIFKEVTSETIEDKGNEMEERAEDHEESNDRDWMTNFTSDPKDRSRVIPLELSMAYMESDAYTQTYGNKRVSKNFPHLIYKIIHD